MLGLKYLLRLFYSIAVVRVLFNLGIEKNYSAKLCVLVIATSKDY